MIKDIKRQGVSLKRDMSGGLLAAIIGLPMGLAFGVQAGLGAQAGIYTAIILALVTALIGGTKTLISDPTGPMTVVAATVVSLGVTSAGTVENALPLIIGTFVLAGLFEFIFGILDFGRFVKYMPYPVVSSFMTGIGVIIISMQLYPFLGYTSPKGMVNIMSNIDTTIAECNMAAVGLGTLAIAIIYLFPFITKKIPSVLVALVVCTVIAIVSGVEVPVIGSIPRELPSMHLMDLQSLQWSDLSLMIAPAVMIGGLGVIDSFTVTNIKAGGMTRASGFFKGIFLLIIIIGVADYVAMIPMSVLASILIYTGFSIIDYKGIKMLLKVPRSDAMVWGIVLLFTVFNNLLNAVAAGFILACFLFVAQLVNSMKVSHVQHSLQGSKLATGIPKELAKAIYVQVLEGPLFFGFTDHFRAKSGALEDTKGVKVYIAGANKKVKDSLTNLTVIPRMIPAEKCFDSFEEAIHHVKKVVKSDDERDVEGHINKPSPRVDQMELV